MAPRNELLEEKKVLFEQFFRQTEGSTVMLVEDESSGPSAATPFVSPFTLFTNLNCVTNSLFCHMRLDVRSTTEHTVVVRPTAGSGLR